MFKFQNSIIKINLITMENGYYKPSEFNYTKFAENIAEYVRDVFRANVWHNITDKFTLELKVNFGEFVTSEINLVDVSDEIKDKELTEDFMFELVQRYTYNACDQIIRKRIFI